MNIPNHSSYDQKINSNSFSEQPVTKQSRFGFTKNSLLDQTTNNVLLKTPLAETSTQELKQIDFSAVKIANNQNKPISKIFTDNHGFKPEPNHKELMSHNGISLKNNLVFEKPSNIQNARKLDKFEWLDIENEVKNGGCKLLVFDDKNNKISFKEAKGPLKESDVHFVGGKILLPENKQIDLKKYQFDENISQKDLEDLQNAIKNNNIFELSKDEFKILNEINTKRLSESKNNDNQTDEDTISNNQKIEIPRELNSAKAEKKEVNNKKIDTSAGTAPLDIIQNKNEKAASVRREEERELKKAEQKKEADKANVEKIDERILNNLKNKT